MNVYRVSVLLIFLVPPQFFHAQEANIELDEAQVSDVSMSKIIQTASRYLEKKMAPSATPRFYGNGQYERIVESNGHVIQYDRDYGVYMTSGNTKVKYNAFSAFLYPLYSSYSYRYDNQGRDTMRVSSIRLGFNSFSVNFKKIYRVIKIVMNQGPLYSNHKFFDFNILSKNKQRYTIHFQTRKNCYPEKTNVFCRGTMEISKDSLQVIKMSLSDFTYHLHFRRYKSQKDKLCPCHTSLEIEFSNHSGVTQMSACRIVSQWNQNHPEKEYINFLYSTRPYAAKNKLVEREALSWGDLKPFPANLKSPSYFLTGCISGRYDSTMFARLPHLLNPTKAIEDLNHHIPLETQYKTFNYDGVWDEVKNDEEWEKFNIPQRIEITHQLVNTLFDRESK